MKKILLILIFFLFSPITLFLSLVSLERASQTKSLNLLMVNQMGEVLGAKSPLELYSAVPMAVSSLNQAISTGDARPIIIKNYLAKHKSPMTPYADLVFQASEKYQLDYRLIVAIAQCESNLCKKIPEGSYNCWGFENGETKFRSWEHALDRVGKTLKEGYIDQGLATPEEIMPKYAPPSIEKGGPWAKCVNQFLEELE